MVRRLGRMLRERFETGILVIRGLTPGCCWNPGHFEKNNREILAHWDINGLMELMVWLRQQLPGWELRIIPDESLPLPSLAGLSAVPKNSAIDEDAWLEEDYELA